MFKNWVVFYQKISLFFNAIIAISFLPFCWLLLEMEAEGNQVALLSDQSKWTLRLIASALVFLLLFFSVKMTKKGLKGIASEAIVSAKLLSFYHIYIKKFIFMELAAMIALGAIYVFRDYFFVFIYLGILVWFSLIRPTYNSVVDKLKLSASERKQLESQIDF